MLNPKGIFLDSNHSFKMGDSMIRTYGKKTIKFEFNFDETGEDLKTIINKTYKEELYRKNKYKYYTFCRKKVRKYHWRYAD